MAKKKEKKVNMSGKPKHSLDANRKNESSADSRSAATVRRLKMYKTKPKRDGKGKVLKNHFQSHDLPNTRIQSDSRWFENTRVVNQKELEFFREELQSRMSNNYNVILKERKLPLSLLNDHQKQAQVHLLDREPFEDAFGSKTKRKRSKQLACTSQGMLRGGGSRHASAAVVSPSMSSSASRGREGSSPSTPEIPSIPPTEPDTPIMGSASTFAPSSSTAGPDERTVITVQLGELNPSESCSRRIRKIFEERLDVVGSAWKKVTPTTKALYFDEFMKYFTWDQAIDGLVRIAWQKKAAKRYSDMLSDLKGKSRPLFITEETWTSWHRDWSDEAYVLRSKRNAANRQRGGTHTGGSVAHATHASRLSKSSGQKIGPIELFKYTHTKGHDRHSYCDNKSRHMHEAIESLRLTQSQRKPGYSDPRPVDEKALYYEAVGGEKKRRVYGVGSQASAYYGHLRASASTTQSPTTDSHLEGIIQDRISEVRQEMREEMREEMRNEMEDRLVQMQERIQEQMHQRMEQRIAAALLQSGQIFPHP